MIYDVSSTSISRLDQQYVMYIHLLKILSFQPMLGKVRMHPMLVTATKDRELSIERYVYADSGILTVN